MPVPPPTARVSSSAQRRRSAGAWPAKVNSAARPATTGPSGPRPRRSSSRLAAIATRWCGGGGVLCAMDILESPAAEVKDWGPSRGPNTCRRGTRFCILVMNRDSPDDTRCWGQRCSSVTRRSMRKPLEVAIASVGSGGRPLHALRRPRSTGSGRLRPAAFPSASATIALPPVTSPTQAIVAAGRSGGGSRRTGHPALPPRRAERRRSGRVGRSGRRA